MTFSEQLGGNDSPTVKVEKGDTMSNVLGKGLSRKVSYKELVVGSLELQKENPEMKNVNRIEVGMQLKIPKDLDVKIQAVISNPNEYAAHKKEFEDQYQKFVKGQLTDLQKDIEAKPVEMTPEAPKPVIESAPKVVVSPSEFPTYGEVSSRIDKTLNSDISENPGRTIVDSPDKSKAVLTFDVCSCDISNSSRHQNVMKSFDLIERQTDTPVTLFVTADALSDDKYYQRLKQLSALPHVSIQAHGYAHKPVTAKHRTKIWGQEPTGDLRSAYEEIVEGAMAVQKLTGKKPRYFRSATLYSDAIVENMVRELGMEMVARSEGSDDAGGSSKRGGKIEHGDVYLGHLINYEGVDSIYRKINAAKLQTTFLA